MFKDLTQLDPSNADWSANHNATKRWVSDLQEKIAASSG